MQRSYGRKGPSPFDRLVNEQCQKGVVSRWSSNPLASSASSSSSRHGSSSEGTNLLGSEPPKKKKFFKSREEPRVLASNTNVVTASSAVLQGTGIPVLRETSTEKWSAEVLPPPAKKNKFFTSKTKSVSEAVLCEAPVKKIVQIEEEQIRPPSIPPSPSPPPPPSPPSPPSPPKVPPLGLKLNAASSHFKPFQEEESPESAPESAQESLGEEEENPSDEERGLLQEAAPSREDDLAQRGASPQATTTSSPSRMDWTQTDTPPSPTRTSPTQQNKECKVPEVVSMIHPSSSSEEPSSLEDTSTKSLTVASIKEREESSTLASSTTSTKRSIFKSKVGSRKAKYNHQWNPCGLEDKEEQVTKSGSRSSGILGTSSLAKNDAYGMGDDFDEPFDGKALVKVSKPKPGEEDETITSVKCSKSQKSYFTVVKSVKKAHQIQDSGEFQEFNDDVDYILGGLGSQLPLSTRCLSTITLASKCMESSFRMHLRAHGVVTKFFTELRDSPEKASLGLCAAAVLFVLSQDRLNMDLDKNSLELMLNLLDTDARNKDSSSPEDEKEFNKNKDKVKDLCAAMKTKGHAKNLSLDHISADHLAMETLLSLTSKRAGEWFKEDLRELGGLDHLVRTLSECVNYLLADEISMWTDSLLSKLRKADRVLKVLENVTSENEDNCLYLLNYEEGKCFNVVHSLVKLLSEALPSFPNNLVAEKDSVGYTLCEVLLDTIRVYINLVHDYHTNSVGSKKGGLSDLIEIILHCLFVLPNFVPINKSFDLSVLCLTLLINLVENCENNRKLMFLTKIPSDTPDDPSVSGVEGLVNLFIEKESSARHEESKTDNILDGVSEDQEEESQKKSREEVIDETISKLLQKAGRHMEDTLIASYITLIIGYTILDNKEHELSVRKLLPNENFVLMMSILNKFYNFMNLTASSTLASSRGIKATDKIIKYLQSIDSPEKNEDSTTNNDDSKEECDQVDLAQVSNEKLSIMEDDMKPSEDDEFGYI